MSPLPGLPSCRSKRGGAPASGSATAATMSIQNELGNSNEAGLTELARGQVLSPKVDSLDSIDSIDSIESLDSLDSLDSLGPTHSSSLSHSHTHSLSLSQACLFVKETDNS